MPERDKAVNPDERIVEVVVTRKGRVRRYYGIRDEFLDYWRSVMSISDDRAWTRDKMLRALFPSREAAGKEMRSIWEYRRQRACAWETRVLASRLNPELRRGVTYGR